MFKVKFILKLTLIMHVKLGVSSILVMNYPGNKLMLIKVYANMPGEGFARRKSRVNTFICARIII